MASNLFTQDEIRQRQWQKKIRQTQRANEEAFKTAFIRIAKKYIKGFKTKQKRQTIADHFGRMWRDFNNLCLVRKSYY